MSVIYAFIYIVVSFYLGDPWNGQRSGNCRKNLVWKTNERIGTDHPWGRDTSNSHVGHLKTSMPFMDFSRRLALPAGFLSYEA